MVDKCLHMDDERCLWPSARSCRKPREDLIKQFRVIKKCKNQFDCLVHEIVIHKTFKTQPKCAIRLHSCESIYIMHIFIYFSNLADFTCSTRRIFLDNAVMMTPKLLVLSLSFTCLCTSKSLLQKILYYIILYK